jgi:hypothetical protein
MFYGSYSVSFRNNMKTILASIENHTLVIHKSITVTINLQRKQKSMNKFTWKLRSNRAQSFGLEERLDRETLGSTSTKKRQQEAKDLRPHPETKTKLYCMLNFIIIVCKTVKQVLFQMIVQNCM